jgi:UDP-N-acetylmuramoyl-tripeptide--D-alanyl-D-alanine ligase
MNIAELYKVFEQHPSIQTDTRKLKKGDLYFALRGPNFDGNSFASQALENGAAYTVIDDEKYMVDDKTILVDDVLRTLQQLALYHRRQLNIPFLAITGSNGKTTTKELIHAVLSSHFVTYTTTGNLNNHIGVPLTILSVKKDAQIAVIEMGANHLGEIKSYCEYTLPTHGLITNCGKAHLEGFGSVENIRKAKGELFDFLRENDGTAFINADYDYLEEMSLGIPAIIRYGTNDFEYTGEIIDTEPFLKVRLKEGKNSYEVQTKLVGAYNLPNITAAFTVGKYFLVPEEKISLALENYIPSNSRSQLVEKGSNKIILDAYNANPSSMTAAVQNFALLQRDNKMLVLGAMAELGKDSIAEHEALAKLIAQYNWKEVILVGGDFMKIDHPFRKFADANEAAKWLGEQNIKESYLLIKGSRSMQMEKVLEHLGPGS